MKALLFGFSWLFLYTGIYKIFSPHILGFEEYHPVWKYKKEMESLHLKESILFICVPIFLKFSSESNNEPAIFG